MRDVLTIPENRHIDELLEDPPKAKSSMVVAIDEWGSCEGHFTLEGIVEEIAGEIWEGFDDDEPVVKELGDGTYRMDARIPIGEVSEPSAPTSRARLRDRRQPRARLAGPHTGDQG